LVSRRNYLLLRTDGGSPGVLEDDDPLYAQFEDQVLSDPYLATLVSLFENTTTAYASANRAAPVPATIANPLMIVLETTEAGAIYDLRAHYGKNAFSVELALGLGNQGRIDLAWAQDHMAEAMGPLLLGLAGLPPTPGQAALYEPTTPDVALYHGFSAALEAAHGQPQLDRLQRVRDNGYRFRYADAQPTLQIRPREEALHTPGVLATFFLRLFQRTGNYYPQRHLLWFFVYPSDQIPYAKVILTLNEMSSQKPVSVQGFIDTYSEMFPSDREMILALADEVFGQADP
jgi:hypothetical protein